MKKGLELTYTPSGITFTVRNPKGQVTWFKFVTWWKYAKHRAMYDAKAMAQEKAALERG